MTPMPSPEAAFRPYKQIVEEFAQAVPIILWGVENVVPIQVMPPEDWPAEASLTDLYARVTDGLIEKLGRPSWVIVSAEAWMGGLVSQAEVDGYRHGDLEKQARAEQEAGGDSSIQECVMIVGVSTTEEWGYRVPFKRQEHQVRWGEPDTSTADGGIADLLKHIVRHTEEST